LIKKGALPVKLPVAAIQMRSGLDPEANRAQAADLIRQAAAQGARLVATPENTTRLDRDRPRLFAALEAADPVIEDRAWGRLAEEHGVWLLLGSTPRLAGPMRAHNRSILFGPDGKIRARYDKIHLFDVQLGAGEAYKESETIAPGAKAVLADGPMGAKLGLTICYDLRFAHLYRALAKAGAEILFVPSAFTAPTGQAHWEVLLRARAIETGAYLVAPAQGGHHEDGRTTYGHSLIIAPWGEVIAAAKDDEPGLLFATLDLAKVQEARAKIPALTHDVDFTGP
jgi:deaminated glutathione amidase